MECVCSHPALLPAPAAPAESGALILGDFLLAAQEKVTSRRAAPGELIVGTDQLLPLARQHDALARGRALNVIAHKGARLISPRFASDEDADHFRLDEYVDEPLRIARRCPFAGLADGPDKPVLATCRPLKQSCYATHSTRFLISWSMISVVFADSVTTA